MPSALHYSHARFTLRAQTDVRLGAFAQATLRSALGGALRAATCSTGAPTCQGCAFVPSCPYGALFAPDTRPAALHAGFGDVPRSYVVHLARPLASEIAAPTDFSFDVVLVESAASALPALVGAVRRLEHTGLGDHREAGAGRVRLQRVESVHTPALLWTRSRGAVTLAPPALPLGLQPPPPAGAPLDLHFDTPVRLLTGGQVQHAPTLETLVRALVRRVGALAAVHGRLDDALRARLDGYLDDARPLDARAQFVPAARSRYSARQGQRFNLDGALGTLRLAPGWDRLWPLLAAGETLHVGKNTTHGLGQYRLAPVHTHHPVA